MFRLLKRALGAAGLAVALALVPQTAAAAVIDCTVQLEGPCSGAFSEDDPMNVYKFGAYNFIVGFDQVVQGGFFVAIELALFDPNDAGFDARLPGDLDCVPLDGVSCVEFLATTNGEPNVHWVALTGDVRRGVNIGVEWAFDTNDLFPEVFLLHNRSDTPDDGFADISAIYCPDEGFTDGEGQEGDCQMQFFTNGGAGTRPLKGASLGEDDPGVGGRGDDFSSFTVGGRSVPEPGLLVLLSGGMAAAFYRRHRKAR